MKTKSLFLLFTLAWLGGKTQNLPDFKTGISFSYGYDQVKREINLTWDFFNVGGTSNTTFTIAYIASTDMVIDASDFLIEARTYNGAVANAFSTVSFSYAFSPGDLPSNLYNLIVYLDYGDAVAESNENNNIVKFGSFNFAGTATQLHTQNLNDKAITLYPNPTASHLNLFLNGADFDQDAEITITNGSGAVCFKSTLLANTMHPQLELNLTDLPEGLYGIVITCKGKQMYREKFIKLASSN